MKKKVLLTLAMALMLCALFAVGVSAAQTASGTCGDNLTWVLTDDGTLTISGAGKMWEWGINFDGVTVVQTNAPWYSYNNSIKTVIIENGVTSVGNYAFDNCTSLTSITIPEGVLSIGNCAFWGCNALAELTSVGNQFVAYCNVLTNICVADDSASFCDVDGVLFNKDKTTLVAYPAGKTDSEYAIPDGVVSVVRSAFDGCSRLTSITIPASVAASVWPSVGLMGFPGCSNLQNITVDTNNTAYCDIDGVLFSKDMKTLMKYPAAKTAASYVIPASVADIESMAFQNCHSLQSVTIPDGISYIGNTVFHVSHTV